MRALLTVVVAALAAFGARTISLAGEPAAAEAPPDALLAEATLLRQESERLAGELERRSSALATPLYVGDEIGEAEIAAALERWRAAHPAGEAAAAERHAEASERAGGKFDLGARPMSEIVRLLSGNRFDDQRQQEIFEELRANGRIDEYLAAIEALAAADPENAELQVTLGHAYLQKLFGSPNAPDTGDIAWKSDKAFDRALEIDDTNWNARFSKAVSLSNWPAFLGRAPEAIEHFELLIEQQEGQPPRPEFAMPYLFLGNMHQAAGKREQALAAWRAGLALFPTSEELRRAVELAEKR